MEYLPDLEFWVQQQHCYVLKALLALNAKQIDDHGLVNIPDDTWEVWRPHNPQLKLLKRPLPPFLPPLLLRLPLPED